MPSVNLYAYMCVCTLAISECSTVTIESRFPTAKIFSRHLMVSIPGARDGIEPSPVIGLRIMHLSSMGRHHQGPPAFVRYSQTLLRVYWKRSTNDGYHRWVLCIRDTVKLAWLRHTAIIRVSGLSIKTRKSTYFGDNKGMPILAIVEVTAMRCWRMYTVSGEPTTPKIIICTHRSQTLSRCPRAPGEKAADKTCR